MKDGLVFLSAAENRHTFLRRISYLFVPTSNEYRQILKAYDYAKDAFRDIYREGGDRYFEHVRAVAIIVIDYLRVKDFEVIIAALLHDIVEDVDAWTIQRVRAEFGDRVAYLVKLLTKPPIKERYPDWENQRFEDILCENKEERNIIYHSRFEFAPREFFFIKLADRWHNLLTQWDTPSDKIRRKIAETKIHYLVFAEKHCILIHELEEIIQKLNEADV